ncbi:NAD(P)-dependent oxidoreductase [Micromonospora sp. H33]|uniref:NAD(P)-dependent oxidoreductase n=1 Tax=Micromonospora sp. H33 TaxID=3452215 RepID=UPI003F8CC292
MTTSTTFLGLGAMGSALAAAALAAGRHTVVWNRSTAPAQALGARGAVVADTATQAVSGDGVIVVCLLDYRSVHEVLDPLAAGLAGRTVINLTTTTPEESRELARWAAEHGVTYLGGAIMAVPEMIGTPGAEILYSGAGVAFEAHRPLLDLWGASGYFGPDPGMASLYDMAMLAGMYTLFAGFLHGAAMVGAAGVSATDFAERQVPFLAAMTGQLAGYAATVDAKDYTGGGQQSLRFTETALAALLRAGTEHGVDLEVLRPVHAIVRRQIAAGFGEHGTARMFESMRSTR